MITLIKNELRNLFGSVLGLFFAFSLLLITGLMLWLFAGDYNLLDNGYASLQNLFSILPLLFIVLIPALTMRSIAEEKKSKTLELVFSRPIRPSVFYLSKLISTWLFIIVSLLPTFVYFITLYNLAIPIGNIDTQSIIASYISIFALSLVFCSIGIFCSSITRNQVQALLLAILLNVVFFYGFDLCCSLFLSSNTQYMLSLWGLSEHYRLMQRGVIQLNDIVIIINYTLIFAFASIYVLSVNKHSRAFLIRLSILFFINFVFILLPTIRFDFTADKQYSLSDYSKKMLAMLSDKQPLTLNIFLEGDLNPAFKRLQNATKNLTSDLNRYSHNAILVHFIDPNSLVETKMVKEGMPGIVLNEVSRDGKSSQKRIYPYAQLISGQDSIPISLLTNVVGNSGEENLNASIENLEFNFVDAIRLVAHPKNLSIAFIEGHHELPRAYVQDAEILLSKYFSVSRGKIGYNTADLNNFRVIIIAGSSREFSEHEKYVIDQYIMNGGRVLWLIDGVYYSPDELNQTGQSPSMKNNTNLDDLFFNYGIRINPVLIQDALCSNILLNVGTKNGESTIIPSYYSPLLIPSPDNAITCDISNIKTTFASSIDFVGHTDLVTKKVLLSSSGNSHVVRVPEMINFEVSAIQSNPHYFNVPSVPVAVSLEGIFESAFVNRSQPDSIVSTQPFEKESKHTKMIVVASSDIIKNEITGTNNHTQVLPIGYDRLSGKQFGNRNFIVNSINWLANDDNWLALRSKQQKLRLLDKNAIYAHRTKYMLINILLPLFFIFCLFAFIEIRRRLKYH